MNGLTKEVKATCGNTILIVGLSNKDEVMYVKSTIRVKPKNRKQKKEFKSQSYRMRKVAKGDLMITCYDNIVPVIKGVHKGNKYLIDFVEVKE